MSTAIGGCTERLWVRRLGFARWIGLTGLVSCGLACSSEDPSGAKRQPESVAAEAAADPGDGETPAASEAQSPEQGADSPQAEAEPAPAGRELIAEVPLLVQTPVAEETPITAVEACLETRSVSELKEAALLLVVDTSGSMRLGTGERLPNFTREGPSRLEVTQQAIQDALSGVEAGVHVGLIEYAARATRNSSCVSGVVRSGLARMGEPDSAERQRVSGAVADLVPDGDTPTLQAYNFGLQTLADYVPDSLEGGTRIVALLTDGVPGAARNLDACPIVPGSTTGAGLAQLATEAQVDDGVLTFVLGSPGSENGRSELSQMAEAGGTAEPGCSHDGPNYCHIDMTADDDLSAALAGALSQVTERLISCNYSIPERSAEGELVDRDRINVQFTDSGGAVQQLARNDADDCESGWFFDGDTLELCSATCEAVQAARAATLDLFLGCETRVAPPTVR